MNGTPLSCVTGPGTLGVTSADTQCTAIASPTDCSVPCVDFPVGDGDHDGEAWPSDSDETSPPFPPDSPFHDGDGDGLPDLYDLVINKDGARKLNANGVLPKDAAEARTVMLDALAEVGLANHAPHLLPPGDADLNGDGVKTLGENLRAWADAAHARVLALFQAFSNQTISLKELAAGLSARLAEINVVQATMCALAPHACGALYPLVEALETASHGVWKSVSIQAEQEDFEVLLKVMGPGFGDVLDDPDGGLDAPADFVKVTGESGSLDGPAQPRLPANLDSLTGDPVNTASGEFSYDAVDLEIGGRGLDLVLRRFYSSHSVHTGMLGNNWTMPLLETRAFVWPGARVLTVLWGDGTQSALSWDAGTELFIGDAGEASKARWVQLGGSGDCEVVQSGGAGLVLRKSDGTTHHFCPPSWRPGQAGGICWLRKVEDPYGNALVLRRDQHGCPRSIHDTLGRRVELTFDADHRLVRVDAPFLETPARVTYRYDTATGDLLAVENTAVAYLSADGALLKACPIEEYTYDSPPGSSTDQRDRFQQHNLTSLRRGGVLAVSIEYYRATPGELFDPAVAYAFDKVRSHTIDGHVTHYRYSGIDPVLAPDPFDDPLHPRITRRTEALHPDGTVERFLHGEGLLLRHEILNGCFAADWSALGQPYAAPGETAPVGAWFAVYEYDDEAHLTRLLATNDLVFPQGRATEYSYLDTTHDRLLRAEPVLVVQRAWPGTETRAWSYELDPVTAAPIVSVDPLGSRSVTTLEHHELDYDAARLLASVAGWNLLPPDPTAHGARFGRGDLNGDGVLGRTLQPVVIRGPAVEVAAPNGPGTATLEVPTVVARWNTFGELIGFQDARGVWMTTDRSYSTDAGRALLVDRRMRAGSDELQQIEEFFPSGRLALARHADGSATRFVYDARGLTLLRCQLPSQHAIGHSVSEAAIPAPAIPAERLAHDGDEIVEATFYDLAGRAVGRLQPTFRADGGLAWLQDGARPALDEQLVYDSADEIVERHLFVRNELGVPLDIARERFDYDGHGHLVRQTTPLGASKVFTYDPRGLRIASSRFDRTGAARGTESWDHDVFGHLVRHATPLVNPESYELDGFGRAVVLRLSNGSRLEQSYDLADRVLVRELRAAAVHARTETTYDAAGRVLRTKRANLIVEPGGVVVPAGPLLVEENGYGRAGELLWSATDPAGSRPAIVRHEYDWLGRGVRTIRGHGSSALVSEIVLDALGRTLSSSDVLDDRGAPGPNSPSRRTTSLGYDSHGFLRVSIDALGRASQVVASAAGGIEYGLASDGGSTASTFDSLGQPRRRMEHGADGLERRLEFEYDAQGHISVLIDPEGRRTSYTYDEFGRRTQRRLPDGSVIADVFDDADRVTASMLPGDVRWTRTWDAAGRLERLAATGADASVTRTFVHDAHDRLSRAVETVAGRPSVSVECSWTADGLLSAERTSVGGAPPRTQRYVYDTLRWPALTVFPSGLGVRHVHDENGRLLTLHALNADLDITFDEPYGATAHRRVSLPNGIVRTQEFDALGRLVERRSARAQGSTLAGESCTWDPSGNVSSRTGLADGERHAFTYDGLRRLLAWDRSSAASVLERSVRWSWDLGDDATAWTDTDLGDATATVNELHQLQALTPRVSAVDWSERGEETQRVDEERSLAWRWDALGRPYSAVIQENASATPTTIEWTFDALDRLRVRTDSDGRAVYLAWQGHVVLGMESAGTWTQFVRGDASDGPLALVGSGGHATALHVDVVGNVCGTVGGEIGPVVSMFEPFGPPRASGPLAAMDPVLDLGFAGQPFDRCLSMSMLGIRPYDPSTASFVSRDPLEEPGGWNLYSYGRRNPLRWMDPRGESPMDTQGPSAPGGGRPTPGWEARFQGAGFQAYAPSFDMDYDFALDYLAADEQIAALELSPDAWYATMSNAERAVVGLKLAELNQHLMEPHQLANFEAGIANNIEGAIADARRREAFDYTLNAITSPVMTGLSEHALPALGLAVETIDAIGSFVTLASLASGVGALANGSLAGGKALLKGASGELGDKAPWRFAQKNISAKFGKGGKYKDVKVMDMAERLRSGAMATSELEVAYVVRNGTRLIHNTRSFVAMKLSGIPQRTWNLIDKTGDCTVEGLVTRQLTSNGLTNAGTSTLDITKLGWSTTKIDL